MEQEESIVAISSAVGPAARMIVRVSGGRAFEIVSALAGELPDGGGVALRMDLRFAELRVPAWVYLFRSPRSYTGEDLVELHIPGNPVLARMVLEEIVRTGARHAEAGEFTARAYFNGRLDLTAAEGVAATIGAHSEQKLAAARQLMAGELARRLRPAMDEIAQTLALIEVGIDFSDEDISFLPADEAAARIGSAGRSLRELLSGSSRFEKLSHEPRFVLVGRPNAGKSTLLNALAGRERAVTSPVAGTTRDVLTAEVALPRGMVTVMDVAGLEEPVETDSPSGPGKETNSPQLLVARQMRHQALSTLESADFVVLVQAVDDPNPALKLPRDPDCIVKSKLDLMSQETSEVRRDPRHIAVSALTGRNLDRLRQSMDQLAFGRPVGPSTLALNARHLSALQEALSALDRAAARVGDGAAEVLALELREALDALGRIIGQITPDDLLGRVFSAFCIGK